VTSQKTAAGETTSRVIVKAMPGVRLQFNISIKRNI